MTTDTTQECTIHERGNGFPDPGDYVPGSDGELYLIEQLVGPIHTGNSGRGGSNYIHAIVELADWDDVDSDADVFPALASLRDADAEDLERMRHSDYDAYWERVEEDNQ